jgi:Leucine-rich repeat (LRR) protein
LKELRADAVIVSQFSGPLRAMPSLEKINDIPAKAFWLRFGGGTAARRTQATAPAVSLDPKQDMLVAAMKPEEQVAWFVEQMKKLNPGFDGKQTHKIEKNKLTELRFSTTGVTNISPVSSLKALELLHCAVQGHGGTLTDLSPLRGLALKKLFCHGNDSLSDLSPLTGMPLITLECWNSPVSDLSPLRGAPLKKLVCYGTPVSDLSPLKGMPLEELGLWGTRVKDLSPLRGMRLNCINFAHAPVKDISPLAGMPLKEVSCWSTPVSDLTPLKGISLTTLKVPNTPVRDLSVVAGMPLERLEFEPALLKQYGAMLRGMKTLKSINKVPAAEFWRLTDTGNPPKPY